MSKKSKDQDDIDKIYEILEKLGYTVERELWFDEDEEPGTTIYDDKGDVIIQAFGWGSDCAIFYKDEQLFKFMSSLKFVADKLDKACRRGKK